jgi:hypothetical protein
VADFGKIYHQLRWDIGFVGVQVGWNKTPQWRCFNLGDVYSVLCCVVYMRLVV